MRFGLVHRQLQPIRYLLACSDCYRVEQPNFPGRDFHPLENSAFPRRTMRDSVAGRFERCACV